MQQRHLPPESTKAVNAELQARVQKFLALKVEEGKSVNEQMRNSRQSKNPDILEKLVEHFGIKEIDSNYPKPLFDPFSFQPSDFYDQIGMLLFVCTFIINVECSGGTKEDRREETWTQQDKYLKNILLFLFIVITNVKLTEIGIDFAAGATTNTVPKGIFNFSLFLVKISLYLFYSTAAPGSKWDSTESSKPIVTVVTGF